MRSTTKFLSKNLILAMGLFLCAGAVLTACSDDDDDEGSSSLPSSVKPGRFTDSSGDVAYLSSVGYAYFNYTSDGVISSIEDYYDEYTVTTSPFAIQGEDEQYSGFSFDSNGHVLKFTYAYNDSDESDTYTMTITYNGNEQITKMVSSGTDSYTENGKKYKDTYNDVYTLTYDSNGNLITIKDVMSGVEEGESYNETGVTTYTYGSTLNPSCQYANLYFYDLETDDVVEWLGYLGLLGKASYYLPKTVKTTYDDGYTSSYTCSVSLSNGLIYCDSTHGSVYYRYSSSTRAEEADAAEQQAAPTRRHGMSRHRRAQQRL